MDGFRKNQKDIFADKIHQKKMNTLQGFSLFQNAVIWLKETPLSLRPAVRSPPERNETRERQTTSIWKAPPTSTLLSSKKTIKKKERLIGLKLCV